MNKQSMLILMRYDGMNNRIILFYYYEIISLSIICRMKQVKMNNIKESLSTQKKRFETLCSQI
jgi:hypothetical protein